MSKLSDGEMSCKIENDVVCKDSVIKVGLQWKGEGGHLFNQSQCYIHFSLRRLI